MSNRVFGGLTLKELAKRTWHELNDDSAFGRAAELAYYFVLALFPMLIFLTSLVGLMPEIQQNILSAVARVAPREAMRLVRDFLADVVENRSTSLISIGILGTLWAASTGVVAVMDTLNAAYEAEEGRPFWKTRLVAMGLTIAMTILVVGGTALLIFARKLSAWVGIHLGLGTTFTVFSSLLGYIVGLIELFIGLEILYYFGPNVKKRWRWFSPGAVFAAAGVIAVSLLLSLYLRFAPSYSATYGSLGAVVILMLWLYLVGLVLITGGEIDSEIRLALGKPTIEKEQPVEHKQAA